MTLPNTGSVLATLAQVNMMGALTARVKDLPVKEFICLLDFITAEFQQFLRAIELINNEALEAMLEQILDALTLKIGQILQADRTLIFLVNEDKGQLWSKINQPDAEKPIEIRFPIHVGMAGHVAITGKCLNVEDAPKPKASSVCLLSVVRGKWWRSCNYPIKLEDYPFLLRMNKPLKIFPTLSVLSWKLANLFIWRLATNGELKLY